ncbi:hypothetical protein KPL70_021422 [Citrus sinensis]|nr:hypothetical protein KPL70_021422 [Citrus sinensis]
METNTSSTSASSSSHISLSSTLSLPKSCSKHITSKIENLVEYSYIPESAQINGSQFPIMSPYNLYKQKTSLTRSIRTLISTKRPLPKEYIQSSRLNQCALQALQSEQYVTMEIPSDLVVNWKREGYTHLHLGGVRLILTLHGRKGLPVTARIALLDTRFKEYQHAVIGTVLTTLHAGSVLLTFYPNFNLSLKDPNLPITFKTTEATFDRRPNGQVKLSFQTPNTKPVSDNPQLSYTAMITAVQTGQEKKLPIHGFSSEGYPVYPDKINGHFLWDVPEAHMCNPDCSCLDDTDIDEELEVMRRKKKKKKKSSYPPPSCKSFLPQPPPNPKPPAQPIRSCLMVSSHSYEELFPPLEKQTNTQTRVTSKPFIHSPITASGQPEEPRQYEAVLNWQTKNASAQNHTLQQLGKKIDCVANQVSHTETKVDSISNHLDQMYLHLQDRISELDADLRRMINNHIWGLEFNKKVAEIRKLKAELSRIPFLLNHNLHQSKVKISEPRPKATSSSSTSTIPPEESQDIPKPLNKDKGPMDQYHYHTVQIQSSDSSDSSEPETNNSSSTSPYDSSQASTDSESEYADITGILMATETADPSASTSTPIVDDNPSDQASQTNPVPPPVHEHSTKPSSASWFTFDDILRHKWAARLQEFAAWIDLQGTKPNAHPQAVLREFMARSTGSLRDWLESLGEYRQLQFMESPVGTALNLIHDQFIGEKTASTEADRKEYHQMKCCSLKRHLLDAYYKRMSILFYKLNGFNEPSLKHVFIASLPTELQPDLQRKLTTTNLSIADISLGKIFQMAMLSLDKICEQKEFFKDLMEDKKPFSKAFSTSGQFKDSEKNYHVIYKEILAVKYGIKNFEFHLISHKFLINMDNSSFPRIFHFKNKLPSDKQLLSLKTWFAKYDFTVQHIKGNQNLIPDFLTRPAINKPALISSIQIIPVIAMNRQLPFKALNQRNFPMNISFQSAYRFFFNVQTKKPDRFPNLCMEHLFLTGLTLSSLSISEDELWHMWCLTTLYATKLVFPIKPVLTHLTTPEFSPDLLWTLLEWYSPLTWWRKQLQHLCTFHGLDKMPEQEANMWTTVFIVHRPYFQHPETRDYWTQDMAYEWRTYSHPYTFIHDTLVTSVLKAYLMELNNVPPPATKIHHTFIGPSHTLEIIPKTQGCTPGSSSSPQGIIVMEQRPDYTNVLFQDAQDPWEDFQSLLHTDTPHYTIANPDSPVASISQHMTEADEEKYHQAEAYLDQRQRRRHKRQYEKDTGDVSIPPFF